MASNEDHLAVSGSGRAVKPGAHLLGPTDPQQRIEVTVRVRSRVGGGTTPSAEEIGAQLPGDRRYLSREQYAAAYGADPADLAKVRAFAAVYGLTVENEDPARRSVVLSGTATALSAAFRVKLLDYDHPEGKYRGRVGPLHVPADLVPIVEGVFGLDNRP